MSLDVSPDGRTIVFDLLGDIYSMAASGGTARALLDGPAMQRSPLFNADGSKLLFLSDASGDDNLWMSNADGTHARQLTHETVDVLTGPMWGPDDQSVIAAKMDSVVSKLHSSEIRLFDVRGGAGRLLVEMPQSHENVHEAELSPDRATLYYTEKVAPPNASIVYIDASHANFAIKQKKLKTGETEVVVDGFGGATTPRVSRDGRRLAFVRRVKEKTVLFVYDFETREQRPVYDGLDRDDQADFIGQGHYYPRYGWFPDNRHIAIWGKGKLYRIDVDAGTHEEIPFELTARHRVVTPPRFEHDLAPKRIEVRAIRQPAFAPGGKSVVFNAIGRLWRQDLAGGNATRLTSATEFEFEPAFAPGGNEIAYVGWDDERGGALRIVTAGGKAVRTLVASRNVLRQPSYSADGTRLVYKIDSGDKCMGGFQARAGLYWISSSGGGGHFMVADGESPHFSPDGTRIYFTTTEYAGYDVIRKIESVNLAGLDRRIHAIAPNADILDLSLSPDLTWIAFRDHQQYYVMPYREGGSPLALSSQSDAAPVSKLTEIGGYGLAWSADSRSVYWTLGADVYKSALPASGAPHPFAAIHLSVPTDVPQGAVAFTNARIITMRGDEVIENGTLIVESNRIAAVGKAEEISVPKGAKIVDAAGKTIMPGLINMHGHIDDCYYSSAGLVPQKEPSMYASLAFGITTNYDPYTAELARYSATEMNQAGVRVGPRSINSGYVAYGRSGKSDSVYLPVENIDDARNFMARKRALSGTIIKSYRQPARAARQQLIKAAREAGIMVDVEGESHFYNNITMVLDGHTAIEHNFPVANYYDDVVQLMARAHSATTPTLIVAFGELMGENYMYQTTRGWEDPKLALYVPSINSGYSPLGTPYAGPPYARGMTTINAADELWDIGFRAVARSMKKLDDAGVVVNSGSHGQIHGLDQHWEMWLLAQGGMSNLHVLRTSTLNGARTLALEKQIGSLEAGKLADLIVLDANPLEDIHNTNTVRYTMVNGRLYGSLPMNEIGNYDRPRTRFYWELGGQHGIDWKLPWAEP
jgi:imidazolonepropionase-like amidohydrolase/Tol biopolymer transport system component